MTALNPRVERPAIPALSWVVIVAAWVIAGLAELTGGNAPLHYHALIDGGPPLGVSLLLFGAGWLVMVAGLDPDRLTRRAGDGQGSRRLRAYASRRPPVAYGHPQQSS